MSVSRPIARCLFCTFSRPASATIASLPRRQFHTTPTRYNDSKKSNQDIINPPEVPKNDIIKAPDVPAAPEKELSHTRPYTEVEKAQLTEEYTPEQIAAIKKGEGNIDPADLEKRFGRRQDFWTPHYLDDFSTIEPGVDHHRRAPATNYDPNSRLKTPEELETELANFMFQDQVPNKGEVDRFFDEWRMTVGKEEAELNPRSSLVPDLFDEGENFENMEGFKRAPLAPVEDNKEKWKVVEEPDPGLKQLMQYTGLTTSEIRNLKVKTLIFKTVVNQTRLGKIPRYYCLSVAGNRNGLLGLGEGKSEEASDAKVQSQYRAIRKMQPIPRYENRTIYGDVKGKVGATELILQHRPPGFGLRCQHLIWEICRAGGIHDLAARVGPRSRNKMNAAKATYQAIMSQRVPEDIARARGKKMVDVRKVYYTGNV